MQKKRITLTESEFKTIVQQAVNEALQDESFWDRFRNRNTRKVSDTIENGVSKNKTREYQKPKSPYEVTEFQNNEKFGYTKEFILYGDDDTFIRFDTKYGRFAIQNNPNSTWLYTEKNSIPFTVPNRTEMPISELIKIAEEKYLKYTQGKERQKRLSDDEDDEFWFGWD